jgi:hypothetical protein
VGLFADCPYGFEFGANANIVGSRVFSNDFDRKLSKLDPYATLDLTAAWRRTWNPSISSALNFALRNATGEKYEGFGARYDLYDPFPTLVPTAFYNPAATRTWEVGLVIRLTR